MYSLGCGKSAINDPSEPQKALHASVTPTPTHRRLSGRPQGFFFSKVSFFRRLPPARSVVVCRCFLFSKVSFFSHYPLLHTDKKPPKTVRGTQHVRASRDQVWLCQIQVIWVSRFVPENRRERAQRPVAVTTLEGLWPGVVTRLGSVYKIFQSSTKTSPRHRDADQPLSAEFLALRIAPPTVGCSFHAYQGFKRGARWAHFMPTLVTPLAPNSCV